MRLDVESRGGVRVPFDGVDGSALTATRWELNLLTQKKAFRNHAVKIDRLDLPPVRTRGGRRGGSNRSDRSDRTRVGHGYTVGKVFHAQVTNPRPAGATSSDLEHSILRGRRNRLR